MDGNEASFPIEILFSMYEASVLLEQIDNLVVQSDLAEAREVIDHIKQL